jgi:hypothetical protein
MDYYSKSNRSNQDGHYHRVEQAAKAKVSKNIGSKTVYNYKDRPFTKRELELIELQILSFRPGTTHQRTCSGRHCTLEIGVIKTGEEKGKRALS